MSERGREYGWIVGGIIAVVAVSLLVITAVSGPVAAHTGDDGFHHHDGWMGTHGGMGGWMVCGIGFLWMLVWALVLIGIPVALVSLLLARRESADGATDDDALALLRRRYAQGEIDEGEFESRRARLLADQE